MAQHLITGSVSPAMFPNGLSGNVPIIDLAHEKVLTTITTGQAVGDRHVALACAAFVLLTVLCSSAAPARELRVCADPNNLPFSNAAGEGFENRIVSLIAHDLGAAVHYVWWAQRRGLLRNTLNSGECDVIAGIASDVGMVATTRPYYRSTYVFLQRAGANTVQSFDDPRLANLTIGVQLIGDNGANTPPAHALARRGLTSNVRGYPVYGDYQDDAPLAPITDAVGTGKIDLAVVWGPVAGYFAKREDPPLSVTPVSPWLDGPQWPMAFDISMGTRQDNELRAELDRALEANQPAITAILHEYGVPLVQP
jgi:mxaJ protein